jgi:hypothetical protein
MNDVRMRADADPEAIRLVERIYRLWDEALGAKDV